MWVAFRCVRRASSAVFLAFLGVCGARHEPGVQDHEGKKQSVQEYREIGHPRRRRGAVRVQILGPYYGPRVSPLSFI